MKPANRTIVALYDCLTVWLDTPSTFVGNASKAPRRFGRWRPIVKRRDKRFEERRDFYALAERRIEVEAADSANASLKNFLEKRNRHVQRCDYNPSRDLPNKVLSIAAPPPDVRKADMAGFRQVSK